MIPLFSRFFGPHAEGRRLLRDAAYILNSLEQRHYPGVRAPGVAKDLQKELDYVRNTFENDLVGLKRGQDHVKRLHKEARRRRDQRGLTAMTFCIIYVRALAIGAMEEGDPAWEARARIDAFLETWAHLADEDVDPDPPSVSGDYEMPRL